MDSELGVWDWQVLLLHYHRQSAASRGTSEAMQTALPVRLGSSFDSLGVVLINADTV